MLLALIWLTSVVMAKKHYEIALAEDHGKVLIMTDKVVGFQDREKIPDGDRKRAHVLIEKNSIKIGDWFVCKSLEGVQADRCVTSKALGGNFTLLITKNHHRLLTQDKHLALARGVLDENTDISSAVIMDYSKMDPKDYHLDIMEYEDEELVGINPNINLNAK